MQNLNILFDIIIVGAGSAGASLAKALYKTKKDLVMGVISPKNLNRFDSLPIIKIPKKVIFMSYQRGLINIRLSTNEAIFAKTVVIATGTKYKTLTVNNENIDAVNLYYNPDEMVKDITYYKPNKPKNVILLGNSKLITKTALKLSKTVQNIYICNKDYSLVGDKKDITKLELTDNIKYLSGADIINVVKDKDNNITKLFLNTDTDLDTDLIFADCGRVPDINIVTSLLDITEEYPYAYVTDTTGKSTKAPNVFAVGELAKDFINIKLEDIVNTLLNIIK